MSQIEDLQDGTSLGAASISRARPLKANAMALLEDFKGWRPTHYNDSSNYCTIGYGYFISLKNCESINLSRFAKPITPEESESLVSSDVLRARALPLPIFSILKFKSTTIGLVLLLYSHSTSGKVAYALQRC